MYGMKPLIKFIIGQFRKQQKENFFDAKEAYQIARYNDKLTKEQLKEEIIKELEERIIYDFKVLRQFINISTYEGHREKIILPDIVNFFRELHYHVDLLNTGEYEKVNVLIISWQNLEEDEKKS